MADTNNILLLIDDDPCHIKALEEALIATRNGSLGVEWARSLSAGTERLADKGVGAIFLNLFLPDSRGIETLDRLLLLRSTAPIVVLGGVDDEDICKAAMLRGAQDYLLDGHLDSYAFARSIRNISERATAKHELFMEQKRAQVTLDSIGDGVLSTDLLGSVTYLNVVAERMTGWSRAEAMGQPIAEVFHIIDGTTREPAPNPLELAIQQNKTVGLAANCILIQRDRRECAIEDSAAPIHDQDGRITGAVIVFHDVNMALTKVLQMSHLAQHDALTDLPNRLLLKDRLTQAIALACRNHDQLVVMFLDVDGFKHINDSLGHTIGDSLLQSVARRLSACVRKSDTVSRQGGDEFVILLPKVTDAEDAAISAAKIIAELKGVYDIGEYHLHVTVSIGLSTYPDSGEDAETLIKNADTAMYQAKELGRNNYQFFTRAMNLRAVERQSVEGQLRYALERNELLLHYQPKVNLETGTITSVEALIRWQHPERGLLMPGQFLSIAEDSGLIATIGTWVLREACGQTRAWLDAGVLAVPVAINISSPEFQSTHFIEGVRAALENAHLDPGYLELELTETVLMQHPESIVSVLKELRATGVRLALDDFGTGYSSLSYLTRFPIHTVKLDQSFVHDIVAGSDDAVVLRAVITMAKNLNLTIVAEGVETPRQIAFLRACGCDEGQGYYFGRPVAAHEFVQLLEKGISVTI
jgi:diguanylate cyclase (GGDEF)-like protein/PAS domain S-box-containing protein